MVEPIGLLTVDRAERKLTVWLKLSDRLCCWFSRAEITAAIEALARLERQPIPPGRLLASPGVPREIRRKAARSMLAIRGGKATAANMRELGFPNLVKAREARKHRAQNGTLSNTYTQETMRPILTSDYRGSETDGRRKQA